MFPALIVSWWYTIGVIRAMRSSQSRYAMHAGQDTFCCLFIEGSVCKGSSDCVTDIVLGKLVRMSACVLRRVSACVFASTARDLLRCARLADAVSSVS